MGKTFDAKTQERVIQIVYAVGGSLLFAAGVNLLITPLGLYNGGFMGFAQLLRTFVVSVLHVPVPAGVRPVRYHLFYPEYSSFLYGS